MTRITLYMRQLNHF